MNHQKGTLVFGILFQQATELYVPVVTVDDTPAFPYVLYDHLITGYNAPVPRMLKKFFQDIGYRVSDLPEAAVEVYHRPDGVRAEIGYLITKAKGEFQIKDGVMKAADGKDIHISLPPVDDVLLDHLPENFRQALVNAFEKMGELSPEFRKAHMGRFHGRIVMM